MDYIYLFNTLLFATAFHLYYNKEADGKDMVAKIFVCIGILIFLSISLNQYIHTLIK